MTDTTNTFAPCVRFYAERRNGHRGSARTGVVLMVDTRETERNGVTMPALAPEKGNPAGVPVRVWVSPAHLAKRCDEISEREARQIAPALFAAVEKFERSPEYRAMHAIEIARAVERGAYRSQPADPRVIAEMRGINRPADKGAGYNRAPGVPFWGDGTKTPW